ncbi:hypothetical protein ALC53_01701 [Atta colombica]|uniref:Uncharacterized protein n=1 Tax=Atta colombica TaxID=520822 RepID=A0A195BTY8_9HYME|nr:hypothetical protein ALC53_01701 [Atta colombica]
MVTGASASYISFRPLSSCQLFVFESAHIYCFRATRRLVIDGRMYVHIYVHVNRYALRRVFCSGTSCRWYFYVREIRTVVKCVISRK